MKQDLNGVRTPEDVVRRFDLGEIPLLVKSQKEITLEVSKKVNGDEVISAINLTPEQAKITAGKIALEGYTTINNGFSVDLDGSMTATSGHIAGFDITEDDGFTKKIYAPYNYTQSDYDRVRSIIMGQITPTSEDYEKYDLNHDGVINSVDALAIRWYMISGITTTTPGKFSVAAPKDSSLFDAKVGFYDTQGNLTNGFSFTGGTFRSLRLEDGSSSLTTSLNNSYISMGNGNTETIGLDGSDGSIICVSLTQTSLEEKKKNFEKLENALDIVKDTDIYKYNFNYEADDDKKHIGFVIGDNFKYRREVTSKKNDSAELYSMISVLWKAVQEQQAEIERLKEVKNDSNR